MTISNSSRLLAMQGRFKSLTRRFRFSPRRRSYCAITSATLLVLLVLAVIGFAVTRLHFCFDVLVEWKISKICNQYYSNEITGYMCPELCAGDTISEFHCPSTKQTSLNPFNPNRFLARKAQQLVVVKHAVPDDSYEKLSWIDSHRHEEHYPTETEYVGIVRRYIELRYNLQLPFDKLNSLLKLKNKNNHVLFHASMRNSWTLIQNNEYLLSRLYEEKEIFPQVVGTCGDLFITELLETVEFDERRYHFTNHIDLSKWRYHIKVAVLILDYLEEMGQNKFQMCSVLLAGFGISDSRMKYHDLRYISTEVSIDRMLSDGRECSSDAECSFHDCRSRCNTTVHQCTAGLLNNNLQIVCDKIFRGTATEPGILVTEKSPTRLLRILERCARPSSRSDVDAGRSWGASKSLKKQLYNELTSIYEQLASSVYS
ncbi:divergent protein kinase domain 1C [Anopheles ziemanni]|uniref:divergent protein kinase domain 1C n=1 Tax=Anopheles coustani TaxID=139045 RepID=UPI00265A0A5C|nr:divergent protein kinase domain 1C [Anopheles coustani]XP_058167280.1 divergent protein kinase domain 1C [Anopheles ziemanni]